MASTGRLLRTYAKKWGNSGKSNTADSYSNRSGDQLYLSSGSSRAYYDVPASQIDFTTSVSGGVYLLSADPQVYITNPGGGNGVNCCFKFNGTQYGGTDGSSGDTWQRGGHGDSDHVGCFSIGRMHVVAPGLAAGVSVSANIMMGHWGIEMYHNYPSYMNVSDFYIQEFAPS